MTTWRIESVNWSGVWGLVKTGVRFVCRNPVLTSYLLLFAPFLLYLAVFGYEPDEEPEPNEHD